MRKLLALAAALLLSCVAPAQTTGFTNVNVKGTLAVTSTGTLTIASGATWTDPNLTTNQLLYMNSGGFMSPARTSSAFLTGKGGT